MLTNPIELGSVQVLGVVVHICKFKSGHYGAWGCIDDTEAQSIIDYAASLEDVWHNLETNIMALWSDKPVLLVV
jgi:hypothetical protein